MARGFIYCIFIEKSQIFKIYLRSLLKQCYILHTLTVIFRQPMIIVAICVCKPEKCFIQTIDVTWTEHS